MTEDGEGPKSLQGDRYAVLARLGEGGKGVVYRALDTVLDRVVAVKVLKVEGLDEETQTRFTQEAQSAARLTHAHIVATYDMGREDGRPFLVMEYVDGSSLRGLLEGQPDRHLDLDTLLRLAIEIGEALAYAHDQGVLHRDLKPENVMITQNGTAKLMDFGLARALDKPRVTPSGTMVGTPAYMSPENALGKDADARSDLYSFGALLYEMATGRPPFPHEDTLKVIYGHIHDDPVPPHRLNSDVPSGLEEVVLRLLAKDPAHRYQSAAEVLRALRSLRRQMGGMAAPSADTPQEPSRVREVPTPEPRRSLPLIGREQEMETLRTFVDRTLRGEGRVVFLKGEAGVGKTRLGEETKAYAALRGARWLTGRCFDREGAAPYAPWIDLLRDFVQEAPQQLLYKACGNYAGELAKLVPELSDRVGPTPPSPGGHPDHERIRLFEAVTRFLAVLSEEQPLVLFLDDLNWADPASLELLRYVARQVPDRFLLILGAYRDLELAEDAPLGRLLLDLNRERLLTEVRVERLDAPRVAEMIAATFGEEEISDEFRNLVYERTGGNPFFVEEVLRSLVEEGVIYRSGDRWDRRPIDRVRIRIPSSVRAVVKQRLGRLSEECAQALAAAAVVGREFEFGILQEVTEREEDLLELLEAALRARIIREKAEAAGHSVFVFTDSQVRDVLFDDLSLIRRRRYHLRAARALERLRDDRLDEYAGLLAYHFVQGNDLEKALEYSIRAGDKALEVHAHEEAIRHLQVALDLLEDREDDPTLEARLRTQLGDAYSYLGQPEPAIRAWERAAALYERVGDRLRVGDAHRRIGYAYFMETYDAERALTAYEKARIILEEEPPSLELAQLYHDLARLHWRTGEHLDEAEDLCRRSLELARELDVPEVECQAFQTLAFLLPADAKEEVLASLEQALAIGKEHGCVDAASRAYVNLGSALAVIKGDVGKATQVFREGLDFVEETRYFAYEDCLQAELALGAHLPAGKWDQAMGIAEDLQESPVRCKFHGVLHPLVTLGLVSLYRGQWGEGEERLRAALRHATEFQEARFVAPHMALSWLAAEKGDYEKARERLSQACDILRRTGDVIDFVAARIHLLALLAEVTLRAGQAKEAAVLRDELRDLAARLDEEWGRAYLDRVEGLLAAHDEAWDEALARLETSLARWERVGWPYERGRTLYELGTMHQRRGDGEAAGRALDRALEVFTDLDARSDVEKTLARKGLLEA